MHIFLHLLNSKTKMPFLELFDETLDINSTENYELSVQMSREGFAFCILDTIRNKYVLIRSTEPEENKYLSAIDISDIISRDDFLSRHFKKTALIIASPRFTLVPAPLFDPGKKEEYFTFNHTKESDEIILSGKVNDPDAYVVYSVPASFNDLAGKYFPGIHPSHHTKPLLNHLAFSSRSVNGHYIHVHIEREFFNLFVYDKGELKFSNSFKYRNITDILYYVLNVFRTMNLDHDETLHFSGQTEKYDDLSSNFALYIRNLKFAEPAGNFTFSYVFNDVELHRFINLFNLANCE